MAKRISELPATGAVVDTDELELNQSGTSRKATRAQIVAGLAAATHVHSLADVADAGALAAKDVVAEGDIADAAVTASKLADLSVGSSKIVLESVSADQLADGAVTNPKIADGAVTTAKIAASAVDSGQLADGAAINPKIANGAVTTAKIAASAVDSSKLADDAVTTAKIAADAITAAEIAASAVGPNELASSAVTTSKIANTAVTLAKIAANAVDSSKLANNAVISSKIASNAVIAGKIAADAVGTSQLADSAVTLAKIATGAVNDAKIAPKAVGPGQLADTTVTPGLFTVATITVDQQGRITSAASGAAGETNTGTNVGINGVGVFAGKLGVDLQFRHIAPGSSKISVTPNGEDIDVDVVEGNLQIPAGNVTGLGALAAKDIVAGTDIADGAVATAKLADLAVTTTKIAGSAVTAGKIASNAVTATKINANAVTTAKIDAKAVGPGQLMDTTVTPGSYSVASITVDQQGRITAASNGATAGESNTGSNVGTAGIGVFEGKSGVDLQFRHIAPGSTKVSVALNGTNIDVDVVEGNLQIPAGNVTGLAPVATGGTLASLTSLDANGGAFTNHLAAQDSVSGAYTFVQSDSGREKVFTGSTAQMWTVPVLTAGTHAVVHNIGTAAVTFAASGVTLKGSMTLAADKTAAVSWLPGNVVKLTGELS